MAERILGMRREAAGGVSFLVKWKASEMNFVSAKEAKAKIPQVTGVCSSAPQWLQYTVCTALQVVIEFYEEKLAWFADADSQEEDC